MRVQHIIEIDAPASSVWSVTEDVKKWPEWTPTIRSVRTVTEGPFDIGSAAVIKQPGLPETRWTVTALEHGKSFSWQSRVFGIGMSATHEVTENGTDTRNTLAIEISGFVARFLWPLMRSPLRKALVKENKGLKAMCEGAVHATTANAASNAATTSPAADHVHRNPATATHKKLTEDVESRDG